MQYIILFLEGIITFISPCLLPLLPVYISYFAGGRSDTAGKKALPGAFGFIVGFSLIFVALGAFAGLAGAFLRQYQTALNIITGAIVILFGLNFLGIINIGFLNSSRSRGQGSGSGFFSAVLFGIVFSISWTPCVGAFLASALLLASRQGSAIQGVLMLLCYSLGLGLPFLLSALLIERLKTTFTWIKNHYKIVNMVSGLFLVAIGILMLTGLMGRFLSLLTF